MHKYDAPDPFVEVRQAIAAQLGVPYIELHPLDGGTNDRTYTARYDSQRWVVRIEDAGGVQLRRAYHAQTLARDAGVATPEIVAAHLDAESSDYLWVVEERVTGVHFEPTRLRPAERHALAFELGQQLRMLHSVVVAEFGIFPPDPWDLNVATFAAWMDRELERMPGALDRAGMNLTVLPQVNDVYTMLRDTYTDHPRLCHGDCADANILVDQGKVTALIDWEWAKGGDPAANIAYWAFWQDDDAALDALLVGYSADTPAMLRERVLAYRVVTAIDLMHVYAEHGGPDDIHFCRTKLENALRART